MYITENINQLRNTVCIEPSGHVLIRIGIYIRVYVYISMYVCGYVGICKYICVYYERISVCLA